MPEISWRQNLGDIRSHERRKGGHYEVFVRMQKYTGKIYVMRQAGKEGKSKK